MGQLYEFDKVYHTNTGDTVVTGSGSGVHLHKDVTFKFTFADRQGKTMNNVRQIRDNPFIDKYDISIIDTDGSVVYEKYRSGYKGSYFTLTENENAAIFGEWKKDFGIKLDIFDKTTIETTTSELYVFGNALDFDHIFVRDGIQYVLYNSSWSEDDPATTLINEEYTGEGQVGESVTGRIEVEMVMVNDPRYTKYDRVDIYYSTGSGIRNTPEDFYKTIYFLDQTREINFDIRLEKLGANINWWFWFVPWSELCSGTGWRVGPHVISVPVPPEIKCVCEQICIPEGDCEANLNVETGMLNTDWTGITTLRTGEYVVWDYIFEAIGADDKISANRLMVNHTGLGVPDNNPGDAFSITNYAISDRNVVEFRTIGTGLEARLTDVASSPAEYCFFRTMLG